MRSFPKTYVARMPLRTLSVIAQCEAVRLGKPTGEWACDAVHGPRGGQAQDNCAKRKKNALPQTTDSIREVTEGRGQGGMKR
jgi:hypothetical protein